MSRPIFSRSFIWNCVFTAPCTTHSGTSSVSGRSVITTPAAWVEVLRHMPSMRMDTSRSSASFSLPANISASSLSASMALFSVARWAVSGMRLAMRSTSGSGMSSTRPASRTAALAARVPKVTIWQTWSLPYLARVYSMTSSRRSRQKSMSMSGIEMRSALRKRSNSRW